MTPLKIGAGTKVWHHAHVMPGAEIGENYIHGQNYFVGANATTIGKNTLIGSGAVVTKDYSRQRRSLWQSRPPARQDLPLR